MPDDTAMKVFGFPIKIATPAEIVKAMSRAPRVTVHGTIIAAQDADGTVYIDENRAADDTAADK